MRINAKENLWLYSLEANSPHSTDTATKQPQMSSGVIKCLQGNKSALPENTEYDF